MLSLSTRRSFTKLGRLSTRCLRLFSTGSPADSGADALDSFLQESKRGFGAWKRDPSVHSTAAARKRKGTKRRHPKPREFLGEEGGGPEEIPVNPMVDVPAAEELEKADEEMLPSKGEVKELLRKYAEGYCLEGEELEKMKSVFFRHPFFKLWVLDQGAEIHQVKVIRTKTYGNTSKAFLVVSRNSYGVQGEFMMNVDHCLGDFYENMEKIWMSALKSALETTGMRKDIQGSMRDVRLEDKMSAPDGNVDRETCLKVDYRKVLKEFLKTYRLEIHNLDHLYKCVHRNKHGYWHFTTFELKDRLLDFFQKYSRYQSVVSDCLYHPNQFDPLPLKPSKPDSP